MASLIAHVGQAFAVGDQSAAEGVAQIVDEDPAESGFLQDGVKDAVPNIVWIKDPAVLVTEDPLGPFGIFGQLFLVGVALTTPSTPASSEAVVAASLVLLRKTYPRGDIEQTGFPNITLTQAITGCPTSGCGSGFSQLMDMLRDLRGGSGDVYFGGLPAGVGGTSGNCVIGCSQTGDRVGAAFIDFLLSVPHEVGHALGACVTTRLQSPR